MSTLGKALAILLLLTILAGSGLSYELSDERVIKDSGDGDDTLFLKYISAVDTFTIEYNADGGKQRFQFKLKCTESGGEEICPYTVGTPQGPEQKNPLYLRICKNERMKIYGHDNPYYTKEIQIPVDNSEDITGGAKCTPGSYNWRIEDEDGTVLKDLENFDFQVNYPTSGTLLNAAMYRSIINKDYMVSFEMRSAEDYENADRGNVRLKNWNNPGTTHFKETKTGRILSNQRSKEVLGEELFPNHIDLMLTNSDRYDDCSITDHWMGKEGPCGVAIKEFTQMSSQCEGRCALSHVKDGKDADYIPRGEIIKGTEYATEAEWPQWPDYFPNQQKFYICDSELNSFKNMDGRTVWSPNAGRFDTHYFSCHNDQWINRGISPCDNPENPECGQPCPPGTKWDQRGGTWDCYEDEPREIHTTYFDIKDIPYQEFTSSFVAGFRIPASEANKFKDYTSDTFNQVVAECWLGENDERPADNSKKSRFTVNAQDFRGAGAMREEGDFTSNIYALTKIPYRSGVENDTYSCVYGFRGHFTEGDYQITQATNTHNMRSADSESVEIGYTNLKNIYNSFSDRYSSGLNWEASEWNNRPITSAAEQNPFSNPANEHPYCPESLYNPDWADIQC